MPRARIWTGRRSLRIEYNQAKKQMTKKHYVMIADEIRRLRGAGVMSIADIALIELSKALSEKLALDNPRFNRAKFLITCGV